MAIVATHVAAVQQLYVAYFGRPADVAGLDYWTNVVEAQAGSTTAVSASFATQPEYIAAFFGKTNTQVIDQIYANMFARGASTTDGRSYWLDLLNKGSVSINTIVDEVAKGAKGTDLTAVENKVEAASAFTAALDTEAEQAGYNGTDALTLAKAFITGITTDATLTAAIATPALTATVAGVVKAGTPFTLNSALAELQGANKALTEFLEDNNLPATAAAAKIAVDGEVTTANGVINDLVTGAYDPATAIGRGALADQQTANATALKDANTALTNANTAAAAVTGLSAAIANKAAAVDARDAAVKAATATQTELTIAENTFETRAGGELNTIVVPAADAAAGVVVVSMADPESEATTPPTINLIVTGARGSLVLANGVTEADYPGVTALRDALAADIYADRDAAAATTAATTASGGTLLTTNAGLVTAVETAKGNVVTAQDKIDALADAVADRAEAVAQQTEFTNLNKAVTDAGLAFTTNGFRTPVDLDGPTAAGTTASDIFMLGDADTVSITSFGRQGEDSLYVGSNYVLNTGALESGNNSAMEVFFVQNGTRAEVHVEKAAYGSSSDDTIVITLVGVDATDLQLVDGIISVKATAA